MELLNMLCKTTTAWYCRRRPVLGDRRSQWMEETACEGGMAHPSHTCGPVLQQEYWQELSACLVSTLKKTRYRSGALHVTFWTCLS